MQTSPFDSHAEQYDAWFEKHADVYQAELDAVRRFIPLDGRGIEVGVGTGRFAAPLGVYLGVEPCHQMAVIARARGVDVVEGVAEALPFENEAFDFVLMIVVVCFVDDVDRIFLEAKRVLKPSGCLIVGFINRDSDLGRQYVRKKTTSCFYLNATFYSADEIIAALTRTGFHDFSCLQTVSGTDMCDLTIQEGYGRGGFTVIRAIS